jgi:predicted O-methyltransferase YrrM
MTTPARRGIPRHWTPRYVLHRAELELRQRRRPDDPWLTGDAIAFLDQWVQPGDRCLEWGSGRSSRWLAARGLQVSTVEHDAGWAEQVEAQARSVGPGSIDLVHVGEDDIDGYVGAHSHLGAHSVDLALIDGIHRAQCAVRAAGAVKPGGLVIVDNVERYLPSRSRSPESRGGTGPDDDWAAFDGAVQGWRRYWTTNGVTDTAFWFRPVGPA